jgi:hypothetical protein
MPDRLKSVIVICDGVEHSSEQTLVGATTALPVLVTPRTQDQGSLGPLAGRDE